MRACVSLIILLLTLCPATGVQAQDPDPVRLYTYAFRAENASGQDIYQITETPDGIARHTRTFHVTPLHEVPRGTWQPVEFDRLRELLNDARTNCPDRLTGMVLGNIESLEDAESVPLPALDYVVYPAPDGSRLLLVRHLYLGIPRCDTTLWEPVGISRVSVLDLDGTETVLFPYPQHGTVPDSVDSYTGGEPTLRNVSLADVVWSPNGKYIMFNVAYRYPCGHEDCYRMHLYVYNLEVGQLYRLGEGYHAGWTDGGEGINFFRLIQDDGGQSAAHLYTVRFDGTSRQEIELPDNVTYISNQLRLPVLSSWNASGTQFIVVDEDKVMLFNLADRSVTSPVAVPDKEPEDTWYSVHLVQDDTAYLWTTYFGKFMLQDVQSGQWATLASTLSTSDTPLAQVQSFGDGRHVLVTRAGRDSYVLDFVADTLVPVVSVK